MKKFAKKLTVAVMEAAMATSMAVSASAACSHGNYSTSQYGPIYRYYEGHQHSYYDEFGDIGFVYCTITTEKREIRTICGICGTIVSQELGTVGVTHSYNGGPVKINI